MSGLIKMLVVALVLFGISAGASWYMQQQMQKGEDLANAHGATNEKEKKPLHATASKATSEASSKNERPSKNGSSEVALQLSKELDNLREKRKNMQQEEKDLIARKSSVSLIFNDIRSEEKKIDERRKEILDLMKTLTDQLETVTSQTTERKKASQKVIEAQVSLDASHIAYNKDEEKNTAKQAKIFEAMDPEVAAKSIEVLVETGKLDMVVQILYRVQERAVARIMSNIQNHEVAVQVLTGIQKLRLAANATKQL